MTVAELALLPAGREPPPGIAVVSFDDAHAQQRHHRAADPARARDPRDRVRADRLARGPQPLDRARRRRRDHDRRGAARARGGRLGARRTHARPRRPVTARLRRRPPGDRGQLRRRSPSSRGPRSGRWPTRSATTARPRSRPRATPGCWRRSPPGSGKWDRYELTRAMIGTGRPVPRHLAEAHRPLRAVAGQPADAIRCAASPRSCGAGVNARRHGDSRPRRDPRPARPPADRRRRRPARLRPVRRADRARTRGGAVRAGAAERLLAGALGDRRRAPCDARHAAVDRAREPICERWAASPGSCPACVRT